MLMNWKRVNKEVLYPNEIDRLISVSKADLDYLKSFALANPRKRARICVHHNVDDDIHEMFIYHPKGTYVPPHKHTKKHESYFLIEGEFTVIFFDEDGIPNNMIEMGDVTTGKPFFFRMSDPMFRTILFKKDSFFLEVKQGPFTTDNFIVADWAPLIEDTLAVENYLNSLTDKIKSTLKK